MNSLEVPLIQLIKSSILLMSSVRRNHCRIIGGEGDYYRIQERTALIKQMMNDFSYDVTKSRCGGERKKLGLERFNFWVNVLGSKSFLV